MQPRSRSVTLLLAAEFTAIGFAAAVYLIDALLQIGPDGVLVAVLFAAFLAVGVTLLIGVPPLVWLSVRSILTARDPRTSLSVAAVVVGICIWLLAAAWLAFVFQVQRAA